MDSSAPGLVDNSGISTDVLLFSDINLSLTYHYRVHKRGLPHIAFRKNYLTRLRALMSQAVARSRGEMLSPVPSDPVSTRHARSAERESESPQRTRRARRKMWPVRVLEESVCDLPTLTVQDPSDLQGAIVYDCRPPLLPVSLRLEDIGSLPLRHTVVSASLAAPPREDYMVIGGVSPEGVAIPELGVAPLIDSDTDLEDELPTPEDSMLVSSPEGIRRLGIRPTPLDMADLELEKALLSVSVLPVMVTPIVDPVVVFPVVPSSYPEPPLPVLPNDDDPGVMSRISPLRVADDSPILDVFPSYPVSPACSIYEPATSRSRRPCGGMLAIGHRLVRPQWTSTCRLQVICYLGIRRNYPFL